ncbi:MAG TPA: hypothetical protein VMW27_09965 [Thermoanaerobaculia bacterium]|nr:hypothetical protein [Thermoanaerobaculia bacterium]
MHDRTLTEHLEFLISQRDQDEATILAHALRTGIETLYREALIEGYLLGKVPRDVMMKELDPAQLEEIEYQRDALRRDVEWGLRGG